MNEPRLLPRLCLLLAVLQLGCPSPARAEVELAMSIAREVESTLEDGSVVLRREPARQLHDGDRIILNIHYRNTDSTPADRVTIEHPVPDHTIYQPGGAGGEGARTQLSTDGGRSFVEEDGVNPAMVTDIRWIVENVPANGEGDVFVRLRVFKGVTGTP